ncbi:MAG: hypothetical protein COA44_13845 [Arcobacter sp.]|nr:MAG: hypothetical protein COA44_13845 [Arcobacter sp.]
MFKLVDACVSKKVVGKNKKVSFVPTNNIYKCICEDEIPIYPPSKWLKSKPITTAKTYGTTLVRFFNFLKKRRKSYWKASRKDFRDFFILITEYDEDGDSLEEVSIQYQTAENYKTALVGFYRFLNQYYDNDIVKVYEYAEKMGWIGMDVKIKTRWNDIEVVVDEVLKELAHSGKMKVGNKEYLLEYTEDEIAVLYLNIYGSRNRAIFLCTLHGMRIDEVLSIKIKDYDTKKGSVKPSRSKGRKQEQIREVMIDSETLNQIEVYLQDERKPAEKKAKSQKCEYMFVNTREVYDVLNFTQYTYGSFRSSLLLAAVRAEIMKDVRTHTGRSHRATTLLKMMTSGEIKLSDEQFRLIFGWKSMDSATPYVEHENKRVADEIVIGVHEERAKKVKEFKALELLNELKKKEQLDATQTTI